MSEAVESMFQALVAERGGIDALGAVNLTITRALAAALCSDPVVPAQISSLMALLPSPVKPAGQRIDLTKLSDDELSALEAMVAKAGVPDAPPEPGSDRAVINDLLGQVETLQGIIDEARRAEDAARQDEAMWQRLHEGAQAEREELRKRLEAAEAAAWRAAHGEPPQAAPGQPEGRKPSNVVPLARGNGSLPR